LAVENPGSFVSDRLQTVSVPARKLFAVIVHEVDHGPLHPKTEGTATPPEILEACGLDVAEFYTLLDMLKQAGLIGVSSSYPFEEIRLTPEAKDALRDAS
jgi:predicted transcriptional regulator